MSCHNLTCLVFILLCGPGAMHVSQRLAAADKPPNIVFLLSDDQTARATGCYGNDEIQTPQLDQLARQGVRFTNHYNTTSICMASRCSVLTGLYEYRHGCNFGHGDLQQRFWEKSYPVMLREAGYYTGFAGKVGFEIESQSFDRLATWFDQWAGGPGQTFYETADNPAIAQYADIHPHSSRAYAAWAEDFFQAAKRSGQPFCLSISFKAPHLPFTPDPQDLKLYAGKSFKRPANYGAEHATHLSPQSQSSRAAKGYREWVEDYDATVARYYALISGVDAALGNIRDSLEQLGLADNTVIIYTSDNGYNSGSHGFGDKVLPYEEGSKSPLIIYDPRLPPATGGSVCQAVTGNVDMAATIFALAGVAAPPAIDGQNLLPLLTQPTGKVREYLPLFNFWGTASAQSMGVVSQEWKYIYWYYAGEGFAQPTEELFHVGQDRYELVNVIEDSRYAGELQQLRSVYDEELDAIAQRAMQGHRYEPYPTLFDRQLDWAQKAQLLPQTKAKDESSNQSAAGKKANRQDEKPQQVEVDDRP